MSNEIIHHRAGEPLNIEKTNEDEDTNHTGSHISLGLYGPLWLFRASHKKQISSSNMISIVDVIVVFFYAAVWEIPSRSVIPLLSTRAVVGLIAGIVTLIILGSLAGAFIPIESTMGWHVQRLLVALLLVMLMNLWRWGIESICGPDEKE